MAVVGLSPCRGMEECIHGEIKASLHQPCISIPDNHANDDQRGNAVRSMEPWPISKLSSIFCVCLCECVCVCVWERHLWDIGEQTHSETARDTDQDRLD